MAETDPPVPRWVKLLDQSRCTGCHACTTARKSENESPVGVTRTYLKSVDVGIFPQARRAFQVSRCNQCEDAPCVAACPTEAMYRRPDGIIDFDKQVRRVVVTVAGYPVAGDGRQIARADASADGGRSWRQELVSGRCIACPSGRWREPERRGRRSRSR